MGWASPDVMKPIQSIPKTNPEMTILFMMFSSLSQSRIHYDYPPTTDLLPLRAEVPFEHTSGAPSPPFPNPFFDSNRSVPFHGTLFFQKTPPRADVPPDRPGETRTLVSLSVLCAPSGLLIGTP